MILILGASGYVGQAFVAECLRRDLAFEPLSRRKIDYTRFDALFNHVRTVRPSFVINAAGFTGTPTIDACEFARAETIQANTLLAQTVARACYLTRTPWGHVSSGCIFSGAKISGPDGVRIERDLQRRDIRELFDLHPERFSGFTESDQPNFTFRSPPCSFYSGAKALAEEAVQWCSNGYLWRPRLLFDETDHPRNLLSKLQRHPKVHDSIDSLTHRGEFARACIDLWTQSAPFGVYHIVNPGAVTGAGVARIIERFLRPECPIEVWNPDDPFLQIESRAPRSHCILDSSKLAAAGIRLTPVTEALEKSLEFWRPESTALVAENMNVHLGK